MAPYRLSNKTKSDIISIWDYTAKTWSLNQAEKYYKQLIQSFLYIAQKPKVGRNYSEIFAFLYGYRVGKHIVFYKIDNDHSILIVRILHSRMDIEAKFK